MSHSRRQTVQLGLGAAALGAGSVIRPSAALAQAGQGDRYSTANGSEIVIYPISHASFVMTTPVGVIYADPVGGPDAYADLPDPDLILITHQHGDHYDVATLDGLVGATTQLLANPAVFDMLPDALRAKATAIGNGESTTLMQIEIAAIPAYNTTEGRLQYHPQGRDNGYILSIDGTRVYIAGDTEDIPEMRALADIDIAFVPMNLPYTMTPEQAAAGVTAFAPGHVYPYHYRDSDTEVFARAVAEAGSEIQVVQRDWYA